ncbi:MAG: hypothetical protein H0V47_01810 [Chloroflexia bacterium]|nr:hypothetical protein [Chloroflexia bacterium]
MARTSARRASRKHIHTHVRPARHFVAIALLALASVGVLVAGLWGLQTPGDEHHEEHPVAAAALGETVEIPGGLLRVDRVIPESMVPMQMSNFAASGMNMSASGMDMPPEGFRRFAVGLTLVGEAKSGLHYSPDEFQVTADGMEPSGPHRHTFVGEAIPSGSSVTGELVFQAPDTATSVLLTFPGADRPVALDLGSMPADEDDSHDGHPEPTAP